MTATQKKEIIEKLDSYLTGFNFEFITTNNNHYNQKIEGYFDPTSITVYIRPKADINTYAHEIAHAVQYDRLGVSFCSGMKGDRTIIKDHTRLTNKWEKILRNTGFSEIWNKIHN